MINGCSRAPEATGLSRRFLHVSETPTVKKFQPPQNGPPPPQRVEGETYVKFLSRKLALVSRAPLLEAPLCQQLSCHYGGLLSQPQGRIRPHHQRFSWV